MTVGVHERITLTLPGTAAGGLAEMLRENDVEFQQVQAFRQAGGGDFVTIVLPMALTAVQVTATFLSVYLAARLAQQNKTEEGKSSETADAAVGRVDIKIGKFHIGEVNFTVEAVEDKIGRKLSDD